MIESFSVENFRSFKDKVTLSFEATKERKLRENHIIKITPKINLLKLGIIYGANASGKSNLILALETLYNFISIPPKDKNQKLNFTPFMLDWSSRKKPTKFEMIFYINTVKNKYIKYKYNLDVFDNKIVNEMLTYYPSKYPVLLFERNLDNNTSIITFSDKLRLSETGKNEISLKCLSNLSVISAYNLVNIAIPEIDYVSNWFHNQGLALLLMKNNNFETNFNFLSSTMNVDTDIKEQTLQYLQEADFNIADINIYNTHKNLSLKYPNLPEEIQFAKSYSLSHIIVNGGVKEKFDLDCDDQSEGTKSIFNFALILAYFKDRACDITFLIDEIEASLHPKLVQFIIENFVMHYNNCQILATTHYDGLLEQDDLIRTDNIWFASKNKDGSTELYRLSDFKGLNRISSLKKAYNSGKFGAIPNL